MKTTKLKIITKNKFYNIIIGENLIKNLSKIIINNSINFEKCLLVIDKKVPKKIIKQIILSLRKKKKIKYLFNSSEKNKSQKKINELLKILLKNNFHRNDCLISVGGGITGDISGFAASIYKRGMKFINIPTTLLAQVDSCLGGKTGINTIYGKNLVGSFYQPNLVVSDTNFLKTLPQREILCGYAEILKHSLIIDENLFRYLDKNAKEILKLKNPYIKKAIYESCKIKKKVVEKDEKEKDLRKILNLGHTFAHAFEAANNYSKNLNHGEAVILGLICMSKFAYQNNYLRKSDYEKIINHYKKINLPASLKKNIPRKKISEIIFHMQKDKKNYNDKINLILLKKIGHVSQNYYFNKKKIYNFLKKELIN